MSNENRVLAEFIGIKQWTDGDDVYDTREAEYPCFDKDYNPLMKVWAKFRELPKTTEIFKNDIDLRFVYSSHTGLIIRAMTRGTLTDFYTALVNAVEWYNSTVKK